ncbi:hypothetical protein BUALT_Bualt07G0120800 [Buddleja alternifolia]|uniref:Uncharacterized protein n=1 Tax=Buddleja alternifolia TaxID=168488 RepID=A0AAV6XL01_9LAMI|nr:hypothetical protein BUALT_Bualt07G0120800 [Buddleja alternifolia]
MVSLGVGGGLWDMFIKKQATLVNSCGDNFIEKKGAFRLDDGNILLRWDPFDDESKLVGGIVARYLSNRLEVRATTATDFLYSSIPMMILYYKYGSISPSLNIALMMAVGSFVNRSYSLIATAISVDLGTQSLLSGDAQTLATVTSIIDGTESIGAALVPC